MNKIIELATIIDGSKFYIRKDNANAGMDSYWLVYDDGKKGITDILISKQFYEAAILEAHRDVKEKMGL